jgi:glycine cleavage system H protein
MDPKELRYSPTHEWLFLKDLTATVGISRFAVDQLTDLINIELPAVGARLVKGKSFGEVESVKAVSDLYAPMSGAVTEVNTAVVENIQILVDDPYELGWLIKLTVDNAEEFGELLDYTAYQEKLAEEAH